MIDLLDSTHRGISCCAWAPGGDVFAVGTVDGAVDVYSLPDGRVRFHRRFGASSLEAVGFAGDARSLLLADADGTLRLWSPGARAGASREVARGSEASHAHVALSHDGARGAAAFTTVFHGREGTRLVFFEGARSPKVKSLSGADCGGIWIEPDGARALVLLDGVLERWDFSLRRERVLGGGDQGRVVMLDATARVALVELPGGAAALVTLEGGSEKGCSTSVLRSPAALWARRGEMARVEPGIGDGRVRIQRVELGSGRVLSHGCLEAFRAFVDPDGARVLAADADGGMRVYTLDQSDAMLAHTLAVPARAWLCAAALRDDGAGVVVTSDAHDGVRWHRMDGTPGILLPRSAGARLSGLSLSRDGSTAAGVDWSGRVRIWDVLQGISRGTLGAFGPDDCRGIDMPAVFLSMDGRHLVDGSSAGVLYGLDGDASSARIGSILPGRAPQSDEAWMGDGGEDDADDADDAGETSGEEPVSTAVLLRRIGFEARVEIAPGAILAAVHQRSPGPLHLLEMPARSRRARMIHENAYGAAFDRAWRRVAVAEGGAVRVLDLASGRTLARFDAGPAGTADTLAWDPRGEFLAAHGGGRDGVLFVWHVASGQSVWTFEAGRDARLVGVYPGGDAVALMRGARWERVERSGRGGTVALAYIALPRGEFVASGGERAYASPGANRYSGLLRGDVVLDEPEAHAVIARGLPGFSQDQPTHTLPGTSLRDRVLAEVRAAREDGRRPLPAAVLTSGESLAGADLSGTDLRDAMWDDADLSRADLSGADLRRASLRRARFVGANVARADFTAARLRDADFSSADLAQTRTWEATLEGTRGLEHRRANDRSQSSWHVADVALDAAGTGLAVLIRGEDPTVTEVQWFDARDGSLRWRAPAVGAWQLSVAPGGDRVWALGRSVRALSRHDGVSTGASEVRDAGEGAWATDPTGRWLARLSRAGDRVDVFDGETFRWEISIAPGEDAPGGCLAWGAEALAVCGRRVELFRGNARALLARTRRGPDETLAWDEGISPPGVRSAAFRADGSLVLFDDAGQGWRWHARGGFTRLGRVTDINGFDGLVLAHDATRLFACETRPSVWDVATGQWLLACDAGDVKQYNRAAISNDGRIVAAVQPGTSSVRVWDLSTVTPWPDGPPLVFARYVLSPRPGGAPEIRGP